MGTCPLCRRLQDGQTCRVCRLPLVESPVAAAPAWTVPNPTPGRPVRVETAQHPAGRIVPLDLAERIQAVARPLLDGETVRGTVLDLHGPERSEQWIDPWRALCVTLGVMAMIPVGLMFMCVAVALSMVLGLVGVRAGGLSRGLIDLLFLRSIGGAARSREPKVVFRYVLETPSGQQLVRQDGELVDGGIFRGNVVTIQGRRRGGMLAISRGYNETLGCTLGIRPNPWIPGAALMAFLVLVEYTWIFLKLGVHL